MRLLVLDQSRILPWLIRHEFADRLDVEAVASFAEAERIVDHHPPDAVLVSLPPAELPWREFQHRCAMHAPPIPVLYESCLGVAASEVGLEPTDGYAEFLAKPAPRAKLRSAVRALLAAAANGRDRGITADSDRRPGPRVS